MSRCVLITPPEDAVVTRDEAKKQLRDEAADNDLVDGVVAAAVGVLDPAGGGWLGRALRPQTWELRLSGFTCDEIELPYPPLIEVVSVKYDDTAGVERTLVVGADFRVIGEGGFGKASIVPAFGKSWPSARCDYESVRIQFECGYESDNPDPLPAAIKQAVHLAIRHLWSLGEQSMFKSQRTVEGVGSTSWVVSDASAKLIERATESLLINYRIF